MTFPQAEGAIEEILTANDPGGVAPEEGIDQSPPSALGKFSSIAFLHLEPFGNWLQMTKTQFTKANKYQQ